MLSLLIMTADPALGCQLQQLLERPLVRCSVVYPWSVEMPAADVTLFDVRTRWARQSCAAAFGVPSVAIAPWGCPKQRGVPTVVLPATVTDFDRALRTVLPGTLPTRPVQLIRSNIGLRNVAAAIARACADKFTGDLQIEGRCQYSVTLANGELIAATSNARELALDSILLQLGFVTLTDLGSAHRRGAADDNILAKVLVDSGVIDEAQREEARRRQTWACCVQAIGEASAAVRRCPATSTKPDGCAAHDWLDAVLEATRLREGDEIHRQLEVRIEAGVQVTRCGMSLDRHLRRHAMLGPLWDALMKEPTRQTLAAIAGRADPVVICTMFEAGFLRTALPWESPVNKQPVEAAAG